MGDKAVPISAGAIVLLSLAFLIVLTVGFKGSVQF